MTMDHVWSPAKLLYCFQNTTTEENCAFIIISEISSVLVCQSGFALEIFIIVDEIDLHAGRLYGCDLDYQRMVVVVNDEVHARETYHFVQLVPPFIHIAEARHEGSDLSTPFLYSLRQVSADHAHVTFGQVWGYFL